MFPTGAGPRFRYLSPDAGAGELRRAGPATRLRRRGVDHGWVVLDRPPPEVPGDVAQRWQAGWPIPLHGVLAPYLEAARPLIDASRSRLARLRNGGRFLDEIDRCLVAAGECGFVVTSSTVDPGDQREIEKVYVDAVAGDEVAAADLWAKLSWIADDESDLSLRVRFSHGAECLREWISDRDRARFADRLAEQVFPEGELISGHQGLAEALAQLAAGPVRLSERIVYANAPGGGAMFHHDDEPGQLGVVYAQLAGRTAWLALPMAELAAELTGHCGSKERAMAALADPDEQLWRVLNRDPALTGRLVERGACHLLHPGDVLVLASRGGATSTWHSVFALGRQPGLSHSYGIFAE